MALAGLGGCAQNDLGSPCTLIQPTTTGITPYEPEPGTTLDILSSGVTECENFRCVDTAGDIDPKTGNDATAYCTRRCNSDEECRGGVDDTLVCRQLVLDQQFIERLRVELGAEQFDELFGDIQNDQFCARPRP